MAALGELFVLLIYLILVIPIYISFTRFIKTKEKRARISKTIWLIISLIPLLVFTYTQFSNHRNAELEYIGKYELIQYPDCDSCDLELQSNNEFIVKDGDKIIEKGSWKYSSGGDSWIVYIGKFGQLGSGNYEYKEKSKNGVQH